MSNFVTHRGLVNLFLNAERQLRNGWWVLLFLLVVALMLVPILIVAQEYGMDVTLGSQAAIVAIASVICQWLRRQPLSELTGKFNGRWCKELLLGGLLGAVLMLLPALALRIFGWVDWQWTPIGFSVLFGNVLVFVAVAITEELLFRGFVFQRLIAGLGQWPAQLIVGGFFLLTHLDNQGMTGNIKVLASVNVFIASLVFGLAFIRTRSLAMPLGLHFMANFVQGGVLGFGVSGTDQIGLFKPTFDGASDWLTGGSFGLEGSLPGLFCVIGVFVLLYKMDVLKETVRPVTVYRRCLLE